jgi:hypothetical protein
VWARFWLWTYGDWEMADLWPHLTHRAPPNGEHPSQHHSYSWFLCSYRAMHPWFSSQHWAAHHCFQPTVTWFGALQYNKGIQEQGDHELSSY